VLPELSDGARARIRELGELAKKAEGGDPEAQRELRLEVRRSETAVIAHLSDFLKEYRLVVADTAAAGDHLLKQAVAARADLMAAEIAGEAPSPLEVLLSERIASLWIFVELMEALLAGFLSRNVKQRPSPAYMLQMTKLQESVNRRFLGAIRELARVRKLQANTPAVQFNTQINVQRD
jgi:hypothetical protein